MKWNVLPDPLLALEPDATAHHAHELLADGEPEPGAAVASRGRAVGLGEGVEDARALLRGDADAGVGDREAQLDVGLRPRFDRDPQDDLAPLRELDGVAEQIDQHLSQPTRIADHVVGHVDGDVAGELEALLMRPVGEELERVRQAVAQAERQDLEVELAGLDLREVEDVVQDGEQRVGRRADRVQVLALLGRELAVERQVGHAHDAVHGRADLVAHVGQELALRLARRLRALARRDQLGLGPLLRGAERPDERQHCEDQHALDRRRVLRPHLRRDDDRERHPMGLQHREDDDLHERQAGVDRGAAETEDEAGEEGRRDRPSLPEGVHATELRAEEEEHEVQVGGAGLGCQLDAAAVPRPDHETDRDGRRGGDRERRLRSAHREVEGAARRTRRQQGEGAPGEGADRAHVGRVAPAGIVGTDAGVDDVLQELTHSPAHRHLASRT